MLTASNLIGIVALCLFAASVAGEYSQGTLRNLLVRQPRRRPIAVRQVPGPLGVLRDRDRARRARRRRRGLRARPGKGVDTSVWTSATGLSDLWHTVLHIYLASSGYGVLGTALAVLLRSPALAVAIGVAYALPVEAIIARLWDHGDQWLPRQLLSALAHGGTSRTSYTHALVVLAAYAAIVAAGTVVLFQYRDL